MLANEIEGLCTHIRCVVVLQEQGTYTAAAARLGMRKSVISQRISELEKAAGVPLVVRTTRSVRLTDAGLSLCEGAREAYARIEASFVPARYTSTALSGSLRITAPVAFVRRQLIPRLTGFLNRYRPLPDRLRTPAQPPGGSGHRARHTQNGQRHPDQRHQPATLGRGQAALLPLALQRTRAAVRDRCERHHGVDHLQPG